MTLWRFTLRATASALGRVEVSGTKLGLKTW